MKKIILSAVMALGVCTAEKAYSQRMNPVTENDNVLPAADENKPLSLNYLKTTEEEAAPSEGDGSGIFGIRFMPTVTSLDYTKTPGGAIETTAILGYGAGIVLGTNFNDNVGMQGEVIYSQLAQKYQQEGNIEHEVKLSYINIPILLSLNTGYNNPVNVNFVIGPQFGINTGASIEKMGSGAEGDTIHAVLAVKRGDFGFAYGAGVDLGSSTTKLSLGFRGVYGLIDISDNSSSLTTNEYYVLDRAHVKTYSGYIGVTFLF